MPYVSHQQLVERPGAVELAQVASDAHADALVDPALLAATLRGADRAGWDVDAVAHADRAIARIDDAVADADATIDGFLSRAGYTLPMAPVPGIVAAWSRDIARYLLNKDRITDERTDPVARAYRDALKLLRDTADGKFSLGIHDPQAPAPDSGSPQFTAADPVWDRDSLKGFR
jgi:phage gp36-like protein